MTFSVVYGQVTDPKFPSGYYYAHIPTLDLTTHGQGIEGAREAAKDLVRIWIEEKIANGDPVPIESDSLYSTIEIEDAVLGS
jgi:predicted RNase H-like HicB family nuclease